ncbi:hypothetical protein BH10CYA1_BH10CYA1_07560 [soil metagenome]
MKLRYQGFVLIGIPLICQLIFVGTLVYVLVRLDSAAAEEARAKLILSKCHELNFNINKDFTKLLIMRITNQKNLDSAFESKLRVALADIDNLRELVASSSPQSKELVDSYIQSYRELIDLMAEAKAAAADMETTGNFAYSDEGGLRAFSIKLLNHTNKFNRLGLQISAIYGPVVAELQPEAARQRTVLRYVIIFGVTLNAFVALVLALSLGRRTVKRLDLLMSNMTSFGRGKLDLKPVGGNDEIADLDRNFKELAISRHASDEMRHSILAMVTHDMRSPLTSVEGSLVLVIDEVYGPVPPKLKKMLRRISSEVNRLIRLSNDLLDTERIESGDYELNVDEHFLETLVTQALDAVSGMSEIVNIKLEAQIPDELTIRCDGDRIVQVLVNLFSNAIKYSSPSSIIYVRAYRDDMNRTIRVEVVDHGIGIAAAERREVFDKFKQLSQPGETKRKGTGLGLAICKSLIEKHGGTIGVTSEEGKGSSFWFELPSTR